MTAKKGRAYNRARPFFMSERANYDYSLKPRNMKTRKFSYGPNTFIFKCEDFEKDGTWLDTKVTLNDNYFCTIIGNSIDSFIDDFKVFFLKYKI